MQSSRLITSQTATATSPAFTVTRIKPVTLVMFGTMSETVAVEIKLDDDTWIADAGKTLTPSANVLQITAIGVFRVVKPTTVGSVGIDKIQE